MKRIVPITTDGNVLITRDGRLPSAIHSDDSAGLAFRFDIDDHHFTTLTLTPKQAQNIQSAHNELQIVPLRPAVALMPPTHYAAAVKARELSAWDIDTRFCSRCGNPLNRHSEISKLCPNCGKEIFPQLSPAVIVLVKRGDEALLVHAKNFSRPFFGLVAGFVETGETLEQCVRREILEETSLQVTNIRYIASQSWPYPANLMIGFTADYLNGTLRFADGELSQGGFFTRDNLPALPSPPSIARALIDAWLNHTL